MKLKLTYLNRAEKISARTNKPFTSLVIKAEEYGDKYLSGFGNKENSGWKIGDVVDVDKVVEVKKEDKVYLNFEMAKAPNTNELVARLTAVEEFIKTVIIPQINEHGGAIKKLQGDLTPEYPEPEQDSEIPF